MTAPIPNSLARRPWEPFKSMLRIFGLRPFEKFRCQWFLSIVLTVLALVLGLLSAFLFSASDVDYNVPLTNSTATLNIGIVTRFIDIDATAGTLTADWYPLGHNCSESSPGAIVDIYFDPNLLYNSQDVNNGGSDVPSDNPPARAIFQFNTSTRCHEKVRDSHATFRTVSKLVGQGSSGRLKGSLQAYPWDEYYVDLSLFAQIHSTNASVGIITLKPFGSPVNFKLKLDQTSSKNTDQGLLIRVDVSRSSAVKGLVVIITLSNWILSLAFVYITIASILWSEKVVKELFVIPVTALFAFTTVRANMPGAPAGFGAVVDFLGVLPNIALMALSSAILLMVVLVRRLPKCPHDIESEEGCNACKAVGYDPIQGGGGTGIPNQTWEGGVRQGP